MCRTFRTCRLYSWMRLIWTSKRESGSTAIPFRSSIRMREIPLVLALHVAPGLPEGVTLGPGLELPELVEIGDPGVADLARDQPGEPRIGEQEPPSRGDAVGLGRDLAGPELVEVAEQAGPDEVRVELRDPVDGVGADDGEVRHADRLHGVLLDEGEPARLPAVTGVSPRHLGEEAPVDLVDELEVAREETPQQPDRPDLERLGEDRVVRVGERGDADLPGSIPLQPLAVDQDPHQLRDRQGRVGVVELDGHLIRQALDRRVLDRVAPEDVLDRGRDEEVLLLEPELLALGDVVLRIEHAGDGLGADLLLDRGHVITLVELGEVEHLRGQGPPEPERVDGLASVAGYRDVVGERVGLVGVHPLVGETPVGVHVGPDPAVEVNGVLELGADDLPGVAETEPVVGLLDLAAVDDILLEDPVVVPDAVALTGELEGGHRVEEARREAPQAPVPEARVGVEGEQVLEGDVEVRHRLAHGGFRSGGWSPRCREPGP